MHQHSTPGADENRTGQSQQVTTHSTITAADIHREMDQFLYPSAEQVGLFALRTADAWLRHSQAHAIPQMLFSEFWHEGELCILFADTNLGKSILAVQIGDSISRGVPIQGFTLRSVAQAVVYFDFELSAKQFEARYSCGYTGHYHFHQNFYRAEVDPGADMPVAEGLYEEFLHSSIERAIIETGAKVLIIDNLTYLKSETEKAQSALPLMKHLKALKQRYDLSILALAHTPKRDATKPIDRNDLQGSKMLMNFCDSAFAIGESHADKSVRYLKQIKQRYTECVYDTGNVAICQTSKPHNFLGFEFLHFGTEWEHLKTFSETERQQLDAQVKEILDAEPEITAYAIAKRLCTDEARFKSFRVKIDRLVSRMRNSA